MSSRRDDGEKSELPSTSAQRLTSSTDGNAPVSTMAMSSESSEAMTEMSPALPVTTILVAAQRDGRVEQLLDGAEVRIADAAQRRPVEAVGNGQADLARFHVPPPGVQHASSAFAPSGIFLGARYAGQG